MRNLIIIVMALIIWTLSNKLDLLESRYTKLQAECNKYTAL